ncbi:MAG TPA: phytanoyl-CoA dioxygenase family protein [Drouetiella sp.]
MDTHKFALFKNILDLDGSATIHSVVDGAQIEHLKAEIESLRKLASNAGLRNLLSDSDEVRNFASHGVMHQIASQLLAGSPLPVRAIFFDKTPESNWYVTWHQDLTIPVREKVELDGFGSWSVKNGVPHCQPPTAVLEAMVALRLHLDDCGESNGPIKFITGSHRFGILNQDDIARLRDQNNPEIGLAKTGDVIAMKPLVLHSSSVAESAEHRRVLHLEYALYDLPSPLEWGQA